jgi:Asp-tRNA(Asn)/Glu-tRNA(Gln) amidotransferase A subunit family amidase
VTDPTSGNPVPATIAYTQNVVPASYSGLAWLSLPVGLTGAGLPVGLEVDGLEESDEAVPGISLSSEKVGEGVGTSAADDWGSGVVLEEMFTIRGVDDAGRIEPETKRK